MVIWLGMTPYEADELMATLKADLSLLSRAISELEAERETKLRAVRIVWLMACKPA